MEDRFSRVEALALEVVMADHFDHRRGGDLGYAFEVTQLTCALLGCEPEQALRHLAELTGNRDWARKLERQLKAQGDLPADGSSEVLSVLCELIYEIADKRTWFKDQRAGFAGAMRNALSDYAGGKRKPRRDRPPLERSIDTAAGGEPALVDTLPQRSRLTADEKLEITLAIERDDLSARERETLGLIREGLEGQALADALGVPVKTAETLSRRARKKLDRSS